LREFREVCFKLLTSTTFTSLLPALQPLARLGRERGGWEGKANA
jgi:hypothetical protein